MVTLWLANAGAELTFSGDDRTLAFRNLGAGFEGEIGGTTL